PGELVTSIDGGITVDLSAAAGDTDLDWSGTWTVESTVPPAVTTTQRITLLRELPGFGVGSAGDPAILRLEGVYGTCGEVPGWELSGGLTGPEGAPVTFDGFAITRVEAEGCVDADGLRLAVSADAAIGDGPDAVPVELSLTLDHGTWSIAGDAGPFDVAVGPISVADATLSLEAEGGADTLGLTVGFSAAEATLFDATVTAITGTLTGSGQLDLHAEMLAAEFA